MDKKILNILYQSDENYAPYMGVSIYSLLHNNQESDEINIYIINNNISDENIKKLNLLVKKYHRKITYINADKILNSDKISKLPKYSGMRKNGKSFMKMMLDDVITDDIKKIIYIDCDTLVVNDIHELMNTEMNGYPIAMALDSFVLKAKPSIGLQYDEPYYNSGIILFDLEQWKKQNCSSRVVNHLANNRTYGTVDQDVLNMEFKNTIARLPVNYNFQPAHMVYDNKTYFSCFKHPSGSYYSDSEIDNGRKDIRIIHFFRYLGESPWHENNLHPARKLFDKYLSASPWKDYKKQKANKGIIFKLEKLMYIVLPKKIFFHIFTIVHEKMVIRSNSFN